LYPAYISLLPDAKTLRYFSDNTEETKLKIILNRSNTASAMYVYLNHLQS
jgi:hypothetical protein